MTAKESRVVEFQTRVYELLKQYRSLGEPPSVCAGILSSRETWLLDRIVEAAELAVGARHPKSYQRSKSRPGH